MTKIAINVCYGGFSLSESAVRLARQLSEDPEWGGCVLVGESYKDGTVREHSPLGNDSHIGSEVARHDPVLIQVIEQLGKAANGYFAKLAIVEIAENRYRIEEYDGFERVETPMTVDWVEVSPTPSPRLITKT